MSDWQPISTAPKDEARILVWSPIWGQAVGARWDADQYAAPPRPYWRLDYVRICGVRACRKQPPTHWMKLPPEPKP